MSSQSLKEERGYIKRIPTKFGTIESAARHITMDSSFQGGILCGLIRELMNSAAAPGLSTFARYVNPNVEAMTGIADALDKLNASEGTPVVQDESETASAMVN